MAHPARLSRDAVGRRTFATLGRAANVPEQLRCVGAISLLGRDAGNGPRNLVAGSPHSQTDRTTFLTGTLRHIAGHDAEDLAVRLLTKFGSISALMTATLRELRMCAFDDDTWPESFVALRDLFFTALSEDVSRTPLNADDWHLRRWVQSQFVGKRVEHLLVLFGDCEGGFISGEWLNIGNVNALRTTVRVVFQRAFALDARMLLLAHNHPSGDPNPSKADIAATNRVKELGQALGVCVLDHLIVTARSITSMKERGYL